MSYSREYIVDITRQWIGTPYHHQAYLKGVGADCLGLMRGVYIELEGKDPEPPPRYSPSWGEASDKELLLGAAQRYLKKRKYKQPRLGDVLVFRIKNAHSAKHCAIVSGPNSMIHAVSKRSVLETDIGAWSSKIAGVFSFPGVEG